MELGKNLEYHYKFIASLTVGELIIYFFIVYVFVATIQRILKTEIDTEPLKFKPKLLISLILVYLLGFISNIVKNILLIENFFLTLLISGTILIAIIYSLEKLVFGNKSKNGTGIISKWMQHQMRKVANTLIDDSYNKNILHNTELMQEQSSELVKQHRENINLFFIDAIIFCIVFCYILRTSNLYYGTIFILPSGFMLYYKIKKGIDSFNIILSANKYAYLSRKKVKRSNQYI